MADVAESRAADVAADAVVLGVDSSTQSTKVEARSFASGEVLGVGRAGHPPTTPPVSEQDPNAWWNAFASGVDQLGAELRSRVAAIAVAGQQHGLVIVDEHDEVLRPAKLWNDTTSAPQADELVAAIGAEQWAARCGSVPVASFTVAKLAWVAQHEPELLGRVAKVMLPHDWLTWRLTGRHVTDRGDASGTGWFDPSADRYDLDLLGLAIGGNGSDWTDRLPSVLGPGHAAGPLRPEVAAALDLPADALVGPGTGDNMGAALGLGLRPGEVALSLGTSGTVYAASTTGTADPTGHVAGFADAAGGHLPLVCVLNATVVTDTVAAWLGIDAAGLADLAISEPDRADQPTLVPYLDGERTPNLPDSTGVWSGLTRSTTRADLARAAHDGVLCGLLAGRDALAASGVDVSGQVRLIGGGARSVAYRQRLADLLGRPVLVPDADELVAAGAAVQAASVVSGRAPDGVAERWGLRAGREIEPQSSNGDALRAAYAAAAADVARERAPAAR